jgi:hypothetical protein
MVSLSQNEGFSPGFALVLDGFGGPDHSFCVFFNLFFCCHNCHKSLFSLVKVMIMKVLKCDRRQGKMAPLSQAVTVQSHRCLNIGVTACDRKPGFSYYCHKL